MQGGASSGSFASEELRGLHAGTVENGGPILLPEKTGFDGGIQASREVCHVGVDTPVPVHEHVGRSSIAEKKPDAT